MFVDSALIGAALIAARDPNPTRGATEPEQMLSSKDLSLKLSLQLNSSLGKSLKVPVVFLKKNENIFRNSVDLLEFSSSPGKFNFILEET